MSAKLGHDPWPRGSRNLGLELLNRRAQIADLLARFGWVREDSSRGVSHVVGAIRFFPAWEAR